MKWTDEIVQSVGFELWQFSGADSWQEMDDYCRNPDNDRTIWCYSKEIYNHNGTLSKLYCDTDTTPCCKLCFVCK